MERKVWMITGCSSGIGRGIAKAVLEAEDYLVATARNRGKLEPWYEVYPEQILTVQLDVTRKEEREIAVKKAVDHFGKIDILVNNAGYGYRGAVEEAGEGEIKDLFETNFFGPVHLIQLVLPYMRREGKGTIVNISSSGAFDASAGSGFYAASKAALEQVSDSLRKETQSMGIRTLIVEPGAMRTDFRDRSLKESRTVLEAYRDTAGKRRKANLPSLHDQIGSPQLLGKNLVSLLKQEQLPQRILYGSDAAATAEQVYRFRLDEVMKWKAVSVKTDRREER